MYFHIQPGAIVRVKDFKSLVGVIRLMHQTQAELCILKFVYEGKPLTKAELKQIPKYARDKVVQPDDIAFLNALYQLEDTRA